MPAANRSKSFNRYLAIPLIATLLLAGCVKIRMLTYPAEFTYLDPGSVKGVMHEMALSLSRIDSLVQQSSDTTDASRFQSDILNELETVETLASSLAPGTTDETLDGKPRPVTNHLLIDEHIDDFIAQIMHARLLAESNPPNYYGAGQLTGSCNACHQVR